MKKTGLIFSIIVFLLCFSGCMQLKMNGVGSRDTAGFENDKKNIPEIPEKLKSSSDKIPMVKVYDTSIQEISEMDIETYIMGVVAGEMKNDWPMEALKAQSILARTFVLKFCQDKNSKYEGADISTDVEEAQAYSYESINDRIKQAVEETKGMVMNYKGELPYAWFHAHSGGTTELPSVSLDYKENDPEYLKVRKSIESDQAPDSVKNWIAEFSTKDVIKACNEAGLRINAIESFKIGNRGDSGRAATFEVNGQTVSAPTFRIKIGANKLKSTLIDSIDINGDKISFEGRGFGHGVGMSQWGAYAMAENGEDAVEIIKYYFPDTKIVELW